MTKIRYALGLILASLGIALAAPAHADVFTMCPDTHEGVVGNHTSCAFAANVRATYYGSGMASGFVAYSPVTGERYVMSCDTAMHPAQFSTGETLNSIRCWNLDETAEVVIW